VTLVANERYFHVQLLVLFLLWGISAWSWNILNSLRRMYFVTCGIGFIISTSHAMYNTYNNKVGCALGKCKRKAITLQVLILCTLYFSVVPFYQFNLITGAWGGVVFKALRYYSDGPGIDSRWCQWIFQWHISSDHTMALGSTKTPNENEYQEHFLGVKAAGAWSWRPHRLHVPNVMKSGSLNLLEPSGPIRACYGIPLPVFFF
jgi:hypothetical protein